MNIHAIYTLGFIAVLSACTKDQGADPSRQHDSTYQPELTPSQFLPQGEIRNPYYGHQAGKRYIYTGHGDEGEERVELSISNDTHAVLGITCISAIEKIWANGYLIEEEQLFIAEELDGDIWQLGAAVKNYDGAGTVINTFTSWIAGVDGAQAGVLMFGNPQPGVIYRQEYYFNVAENQAEVVDTGVTVTTALTTFDHCVVIREWSELEPGVTDYKFYAPGVGLVKEMNLDAGESLELIDIQ